MKIFTLLSSILFISTQLHAGELPRYELKIKSARFYPETLEIPANTQVKVEITNEGPGAEEFESSDLNRERVIAPGKTITVFLGPLKAGEYGFFGDFHRDTAQGKLKVQ